MFFFLCMDYVGGVNMSLRTANTLSPSGKNINTILWITSRVKCSPISVRLRIILIALPNINKHFWRRCRGERRFAKITLSLTTSLYLYFYIFFSFYILYLFSYLMENQDSKSIYQFATPLETDHLPWESSQPIQTSQYRLSSRLIAMIQNLSFPGKEDENPYLHIRDFE